MATNTRYVTASGISPDALDEEVRKLLREGLRLYGDPYSAVRHEQTCYCQALVGVEAETMAEQIQRAHVADLPAPILPGEGLTLNDM
jgi:hypothetical protein